MSRIFWIFGLALDSTGFAESLPLANIFMGTTWLLLNLLLRSGGLAGRGYSCKYPFGNSNFPKQCWPRFRNKNLIKIENQKCFEGTCLYPCDPIPHLKEWLTKIIFPQTLPKVQRIQELGDFAQTTKTTQPSVKSKSILNSTSFEPYLQQPEWHKSSPRKINGSLSYWQG